MKVKNIMNKYLIGTHVGGIMELPEYHFESPYNVILANNEIEACNKYNKINDCSYFYGGVMCIVDEGWNALSVNKDVTEYRCNEILRDIKEQVEMTKVSIGDFITFYDEDYKPKYIGLIKEVMASDYFECYAVLDVANGDIRSTSVRTKHKFLPSTKEEKMLLLEKMITVKKEV